MTWCCDAAKSRFESRNTDGDFLVAGHDSRLGTVVFYYGFNLCHRRDHSDVLGVVRRVSHLIEAEGVANFKLCGHGVVHYCAHCGVKLREHYGEGGGLLRDDEYVKAMCASPD